MLPIYICEDDKKQLESLKKLITEIIMSEGLGEMMSIACASQNPQEIIDHLYKNPKQSLYFLDIDLGNKNMNGLEMGVKIRSIDPRAFIIIITAHSEMAKMTFRYKVEAMDFIEKDDFFMIPVRIRECLIRALELSYGSLTEKMLSFFCGPTPMAKRLRDIYLIEATPKKPGKVRLNLKYEILEANLTLREIKRQLDKSFYQCHKSYIINFNHVKEIDHKKCLAIMNNGREVQISTRHLKQLEKSYIEFVRSK